MACLNRSQNMGRAGWLMYRYGKGLEDSDVQSGVGAPCCVCLMSTTCNKRVSWPNLNFKIKWWSFLSVALTPL